MTVVLTLENFGISSPISSFDTYDCSSSVKIGKSHIQSQWQEKNITYDVHLSKGLKRKFWNKNIKSFFEIK